jgi:hypothetical protein
MTTTHSAQRAHGAARRVARYTGGALLAGAALAAACSDVLDVQDPQTFATEDLNAPQILKAVADGVEGQFQQVFDDHVVFSALLSDEVLDTSTWIEWADISLGRIRADWPTATPGWSTTQDELLRTRFSAINAQERFKTVLGADATKSPLLAQVRATEAWADLILGMDYCEAPLVPGGPRQPDTELIKQAITKFTDAIALATGSSARDFLSWSTAGRARANLLAGNYPAALADAQAVPADYVKQALYSTSSQTSFAGGQLHINRNRSGGLHRLWWARVDTTPALGAGNARTTLYVKDPWSGQADRRMAVLHAPGQLGVNNSTPHYSIDKYSDYAAPITITSKREMNLIAAEVYWRQGDLARAVEQLNLNRTRAGVALPPFAASLTANEVRDRILSERFAELFVEGHRLADINRFGIVGAQLGAGRAMKMPLSRNETLNNPTLKLGEARCPGLTS